MRILYVTNSFPYPLTSGYLRHYFLMRELARQHQITLLSLTAPNFDSKHVAALAPLTERVITFTSDSQSGLFKKAIGHIRSYTGSDRAVSEMCAAIEALVSEEHFDVAFMAGRKTYPAFKVLRSLPVVFDVCDAASMRIRTSMHFASPGRRLLRFIDYILTRRIELKLTQNATHLLFASSRDMDALIGRRRSNHSTVVANGVDLEFWKRSAPLLGEKTIIFTGVMSYSPNSDAAIYLIEEVLPLVRKSVPEARLLIVGRNPPSELVEAGRRSGVEVTGFVEDVRPYLEQATVFAAPLRFGAGIQNKILEAMAMEVPVVASQLAADGLRSVEGGAPPIQVAEGRHEFAELITGQLIGDEGKTTSPDAEGRRFVERYFSWKGSGERLERIFENVVIANGHQNVQFCAYQS